MEKNQGYRVKLSLGKKFCYGIGDIGEGMSNGFVAIFFLIFCTDTFGINAGVVGTLLLLGRFWDMINDTWVGAWTDRTRSRWGRYRPWIIFAAVPMFIITIMLFWAHPEWTSGAKTAWIVVFYLLWAFAYTCVNIPYTALNAVMTQDIGERASLASWRMVFTNIATILISAVGIKLVMFFGEGNMSKGWLITLILASVLGLITLYISVGSSKEVIEPPTQDKMPILKGAVLAFKNKYYVMVLFGMFGIGLVNLGRMSVQTYYFTYVLHDINKMTIYATVTGVAGLVGAFVAQYVVSLLKSKGKAISIFSFLSAVSIIIQMTGRFDANTAFWIGSALSSLFIWAALSCLFAATPDCVEYALVKTGVRQDGFYSAYASFWHKAGIALGSAGAGWVLAATGYVANATEQVASAISGINFLMFTLGIIITIIMGIVFLFYKIDFKMFDEILEEEKEKFGDKALGL